MSAGPARALLLGPSLGWAILAGGLASAMACSDDHREPSPDGAADASLQTDGASATSMAHAADGASATSMGQAADAASSTASVLQPDAAATSRPSGALADDAAIVERDARSSNGASDAALGAIDVGQRDAADAGPADAAAPREAGTRDDGPAGSDAASTGGDEPTSDAASASAYAGEFPGRVRALVGTGALSSGCVVPLAPAAAASDDALRSLVRASVARVEGVAESALVLQQQAPCGDARMPCAVRFQHALLASGGNVGDLLQPLARELEQQASSAELTVWVAELAGMIRPAVVCLAGSVRGELAGVCRFGGSRECAP